MSVIPPRILSMDGGGVMSLLTLYLIERIEGLRPGFLAAVDIYAGNSAGGINAILMAAHKDPVNALPTCLSIWDGTVPIYERSLWRKLAMITGAVAMTSNETLREFLVAQLGDLTLGQLNKKVII